MSTPICYFYRSEEEPYKLGAVRLRGCPQEIESALNVVRAMPHLLEVGQAMSGPDMIERLRKDDPPPEFSGPIFAAIEYAMPPLPRPQYMSCSCCGRSTKGRQWWNRDTGYGLCGQCSEVGGVSGYGWPGIHHSLGE